MRKLLMLLLFFSLFIPVAYAQDVDGVDIFLPVDTDLPDIFTPGDLDGLGSIIGPCQLVSLAFDGIIITRADPDMDFPDIWLPIPTGNGSSPGGPVTTPPPIGYKFTMDDPTKSGCEYVTVNGTLSDGTEFSITAQVYIYGNTPSGEKAVEVSDEFNSQSDNHPSDPIEASAAKGSVVVQPAAGCKVTSSEWSNGSGEEDNETEELHGPNQSGTKTQTIFHMAATKLSGIPVGTTGNGDPSVISAGCGPWKIETYVAANDTHYGILKRLKKGMKFVGLNAMIGTDQEGHYVLVWSSPFNKSKFGGTDYGLNNLLLIDKDIQVLKPFETISVGRLAVYMSGAVDPDEAMPHYIYLMPPKSATDPDEALPHYGPMMILCVDPDEAMPLYGFLAPPVDIDEALVSFSVNYYLKILDITTPPGYDVYMDTVK